MIEITNTQEKNITFEAAISGINSQDLNGYFRIIVDGVEYGFKAKISENIIEVSIPRLKTITHRQLRESETLQAKLDVYGNGYYSTPWEGEIKIKNEVMVEAKIVENKNKKDKPSISIKESSNVNKVKSTPKIKEAKKKNVVITKEHLYKFMEKKGTKDKKIQDIILETCTNKVGDTDLKVLFTELYNYYNNKASNKNLKTSDFPTKSEQK